MSRSSHESPSSLFHHQTQFGSVPFRGVYLGLLVASRCWRFRSETAAAEVPAVRQARAERAQTIDGAILDARTETRGPVIGVTVVYGCDVDVMIPE